MKAEQIQTIGVIGAGQMGAGIAHVAAMAGYNVILSDISEAALEKGMAGIYKNMGRKAYKIQKSIDTEQADPQDIPSLVLKINALNTAREEAFARITVATSLEAHSKAQLVIEAATENIELKYRIFEQLAAATGPETILCSNTSSISITAIAAHTDRPDKVMGMHFMNPVPVMKLIELIRGLETSDETYTAIAAVSEKMGKITVEGRDMPGFIVNRILMPYINEAVQALYENIASVEDIDAAMKLGTNVPMGPLQLADFIGLDTCLSIMKVLHDGFGDSKYRPSPLLVKYVESGRLGRKVGRGFYTYSR